jgi:hypothetical protein
MKLVLLITAQVEGGLEVAQAWQDAGAPGVTLVDSYGIQHLREAVESGAVELPRMVVSVAAAMAHVMDNIERSTQIVLSVVEDTMVDRLIDETTSILGDLNEPNNGVLLVLAIERAVGVRDHRKG